MVGRPWIASSSCVVVVDAYDPMHLEQLEQGRDAGGTRGRVEAVRGATATLNEQLRRADLVLSASDKQRDLWLGALATLGSRQPGHLRRRPLDGRPDRRRPLRRARRAVPRRRRCPQGRRPRHRGRRPRAPLGRRRLQLVRPAHPRAGRRCASPPRAHRAALLHGHAAPEPGRGAHADGERPPPALRRAGPHRPPRLLQRRMGGVRGSRRLPARRGHRRQHAPRSRGDRLLVPNAPPRLPLGRPADRRHARRLVRTPDRRARRGLHGRCAGRRRARSGVGGDPARSGPGRPTPRRRADDWAPSSPGRTTCSPSSRSASVLAGRPTSPAPRWKPTPATPGSRSAGGGTSGPCTSTSATVAPGSSGVVPPAGCAAAGPSGGTVSLRPCPR